MSEIYHKEKILGREVSISTEFDIDYVIYIVRKLLDEHIYDGYLQISATGFAELVDAELFSKYPAVNTYVDNNSSMYYKIFVTWDDELIYRESERVTEMVYNVLRGLPA
jgi:hypothetical protein